MNRDKYFKQIESLPWDLLPPGTETVLPREQS